MKKTLFIITIIIGSLPAFPHAYAQSTGITIDMIGIGQNVVADFADVEPQMQIITGQDPAATTPAPPDCDTSPMIRTGAQVYRWYAEDKEGEYRDYPDSFCITQGCSHQNALTGTASCASGP